MAQSGRRSDAGNSTIWMIVALAAVVGLIIWLMLATQRLDDRVGIENGMEEVDGEPATTVTAQELEADPAAHEGTRVRLQNVQVDNMLGQRTFWANAGEARQFLVVVSAAQSGAIDAGARLSVVEGTVRTRTDEELDRWIQEGALRADARDDALFATHYLQAGRVVP
jgi:hypothetical protein